VRKLTIEFIKEKCREHGVECLEEEYINNKIGMRFRCKCGNEYKACWGDVTNKEQWQCSECNGKTKWTIEEIKRICKEHDIECLEKEYVNNNTKMRFKCKCGNEYEARWSDVTRNKQRQCPECSLKNKAEKQKLDFNEIKRICKEHGVECLEEEYINAKTKMRFKCKCGNEYKTQWKGVTRFNQWQCPECSGKTSKGEKYAIEFLNKEGIQFKTQESLGCINPKTKKQLYYDFVIDKIIIEIDGEQHYRLVNFGTTEEKAEDDFNKAKYRDKIKEQYAKDNGYKLYRIKWFGSATNENIKKLNLELEKILKENNLI